MSSYDPIDEALNTSSSIEVSNTPENGCVKRKDKLRDVSQEIQKDYYSLDILNALAMGNAVVCWENEVTKELLPDEYHKYLPANGATKTLEQILTDLLKMKSKDRDFTGRTSRNYVLNNFNVKNIEEPLINAYSTLSYRKAS